MSIQIQAIAIVHKQVYACCKGGLLYILVIVSCFIMAHAAMDSENGNIYLHKCFNNSHHFNSSSKSVLLEK